jgi:hypothetical protein
VPYCSRRLGAEVQINATVVVNPIVQALLRVDFMIPIEPERDSESISLIFVPVCPGNNVRMDVIQCSSMASYRVNRVLIQDR